MNVNVGAVVMSSLNCLYMSGEKAISTNEETMPMKMLATIPLAVVFFQNSIISTAGRWRARWRNRDDTT